MCNRLDVGINVICTLRFFLFNHNTKSINGCNSPFQSDPYIIKDSILMQGRHEQKEKGVFGLIYHAGQTC